MIPVNNVYNCLVLFRRYIDRLSRYPVVSPYLVMLFGDDIRNKGNIWTIIDTFWIIPRSQVFSMAYETYSGILCIQDHHYDLKLAIEGEYDTYIGVDVNWSSKKVYEDFRRRYPNAFYFHDKRLDAARKISKEYNVNIREIIGPDGHVALQIEYPVKNMEVERKVELIYEAIKIFDKIYMLAFPESVDMILKTNFIEDDLPILNQLLIIAEKVIHNINHEVFSVERLSVENYYAGSHITSLDLRNKNTNTILKINTLVKPEERRYHIGIQLEIENKRLNDVMPMLKRRNINILEKKRNYAVFQIQEKETNTLKDLIDEITNEITITENI